MADYLLLQELAGSPASPKAPVSASGNIQTQPSLLDADLHDSSAWAQPFAQWNSMMSVSSTDSPVAAAEASNALETPISEPAQAATSNKAAAAAAAAAADADWGDLFGHVAPQEPVNPPPLPARKAPPKVQKSQTAGSELDTGSPTRPTPNLREDCARWFREADTDGDGRVLGGEARVFFLRTGLPFGELSKVWRAAKAASPEPGEGLTQNQFAVALRVVAAAQGGHSLDDPGVLRAAVDPIKWLKYAGCPLAAPRISPAERNRPAVTQSRLNPTAAATPTATAAAATAPAVRVPVPVASRSTGSSAKVPPPVAAPPSRDSGPRPAASSGAGVRNLPDEKELSVFGDYESESDSSSGGEEGGYASRLAGSSFQMGGTPASNVVSLAYVDPKLRADAPAVNSSQRVSVRSDVLAPRSGALTAMGAPNGGRQEWDFENAALAEPPLAVEARLPPLHPKRSSHLTMLATGHGCLFAGPSTDGGFIQWGSEKGSLGRPTNIEAQVVKNRRRLKSSGAYTQEDEVQWRVAFEDADAAPGYDVRLNDSKDVSCWHMDHVNNILWTGHTDGKLSGFVMSQEGSHSVQCNYSWQAFPRSTAVSAICSSPWGDLWAGNSRGTIRLWPISKAGSMTDGDCRELRRGSQGARAHGARVDFLAMPLDGQVVWSASEKTLCLWSVSSGIFLGKIGHERDLEESSAGAGSASWDGPVVSRAGSFNDDLARLRINSQQGLDLNAKGYIVYRPLESERDAEIAKQYSWATQSDMKMSSFQEQLFAKGDKAAKTAGKAAKILGKLGKHIAASVSDRHASPQTGTPQGLASSFNGAANQDGGSAHDGDSGHVTALVAALDGYVWLAYKRGRLERYTSGGMLQWSKDMESSVSSMCCVGGNMWVGLSCGTLRVLQAEGQKPDLLAQWRAHDAGVSIVSIVQLGTLMYSLGADGSLKGWSAHAPHPLDADCREALAAVLPSVLSRQVHQTLAVTWNVNEQRPDHSSLFRMIRERAPDTQTLMVALQEVEMGGSSVAFAAAKDAMAKGLQEVGNANAQWWSKHLLVALAAGGGAWCQVGLRQLSGMLVLVFSQAAMMDVLGEVSTASVACGVLGVGGNKGAVALSFTLYRHKLAVVCSHFAAHQGAVETRNANYAHIAASLTFHKRSWLDGDSEERLGGSSKAARLEAQVSRGGSGDVSSERYDDDDYDEDHEGEGMRSAEMLVWMGDFNYRVEMEYNAAVRALGVYATGNRDIIPAMLKKDQLKGEMVAGRIFKGLHEAPITFQPTYKFDKNDPDPLAYDSSEKQRVPAWTDRIFFRGSERARQQDAGSQAFEGDHLEPTLAEGEIHVSSTEYNSLMGAIESDHKPVFAVLRVSMPVTNQAEKRRLTSAILERSSAEWVDAAGTLKVSLSTAHVDVVAGAASASEVQVLNAGRSPAIFSGGTGVGRAQLPAWLSVQPLRGIVPAGGTVVLSFSSLLGERLAAPLGAAVMVRIDSEFGVGAGRALQSSADIPLTVGCDRRHTRDMIKNFRSKN